LGLKTGDEKYFGTVLLMKISNEKHFGQPGGPERKRKQEMRKRSPG
jgi:hypothetical protein